MRWKHALAGLALAVAGIMGCRQQCFLHECDIKHSQELTLLPNLDCDSGQRISRGEYTLADKTYAHLLDELSKKGFEQVAPDLRNDILAFYAEPGNIPLKRKARKEWAKTMAELDQLRGQRAEGKGKAPNPKLQTPEKVQVPNIKL